jgi:hypothetical protein
MLYVAFVNIGAVITIDPFLKAQVGCVTVANGLVGFGFTVTITEATGPLHPLLSHLAKYFLVVVGATFRFVILVVIIESAYHTNEPNEQEPDRTDESLAHITAGVAIIVGATVGVAFTTIDLALLDTPSQSVVLFLIFTVYEVVVLGLTVNVAPVLPSLQIYDSPASAPLAVNSADEPLQIVSTEEAIKGFAGNALTTNVKLVELPAHDILAVALHNAL